MYLINRIEYNEILMIFLKPEKKKKKDNWIIT